MTKEIPEINSKLAIKKIIWNKSSQPVLIVNKNYKLYLFINVHFQIKNTAQQNFKDSVSTFETFPKADISKLNDHYVTDMITKTPVHCHLFTRLEESILPFFKLLAQVYRPLILYSFGLHVGTLFYVTYFSIAFFFFFLTPKGVGLQHPVALRRRAS